MTITLEKERKNPMILIQIYLMRRKIVLSSTYMDLNVFKTCVSTKDTYTYL